MRTTKAISISLPPAELKVAERLARQTNRSLSGLFREGLKRLQHEHRAGQVAGEYTLEQRRTIDADIAASMEEFKRGAVHGPFTAAEAAQYIEGVAKERAAARKSRRTTR